MLEHSLNISRKIFIVGDKVTSRNFFINLIRDILNEVVLYFKIVPIHDLCWKRICKFMSDFVSRTVHKERRVPAHADFCDPTLSSQFTTKALPSKPFSDTKKENLSIYFLFIKMRCLFYSLSWSFMAVIDRHIMSKWL